MNILLLDEFDTIFSDNFFGKTYYHTIKVQNKEITNLIKLIKKEKYEQL